MNDFTCNRVFFTLLSWSLKIQVLLPSLPPDNQLTKLIRTHAVRISQTITNVCFLMLT